MLYVDWQEHIDSKVLLWALVIAEDVSDGLPVSEHSVESFCVTQWQAHALRQWWVRELAGRLPRFDCSGNHSRA